MSRKEWETVIGEVNVDPGDGDSLLAQSKSDRERKRITRQEELDNAEHETRMAELGRKKNTAETATEKSTEKKEEPGSGLKVMGSLNYGNINLEEERKAATAAAEKVRADIAASANRTAEENNQLRGLLHAAEMREFKAISEANIALLTSKLDGRSPVEIISDIRTMAAELGLKPPDPGVSDPALQIRLLEMQHAEAQRDREFKWQMEKDKEERADRQEAQKDTRYFKELEAERQAKRDEMFANAPAVIGSAIAKGLMDRPSTAVSAGNKGPQAIEVGVGESGTAECISCKQPVAVGPTARTATCAGCGKKYSIRRVTSESPPDSTAEEVTEE
jgi:predicted RNA-binding Zn-ribbon protein involved in translation (DUF1610 family)